MLSAGTYVVEAAPLQLRQGADHPRCQHDTGNHVIGQLGSHRVATAVARSRVRSTSTISRAAPRMTRASAHAEPTAPAPMIPTFIISSSIGLARCQDLIDD